MFNLMFFFLLVIFCIDNQIHISNFFLILQILKKSERILRFIQIYKILIELKDLLIEKIISLKIFRNEEKLKKKKRVNNLDDDMELLNMETLQIEIKFGE